MNLCEDKRTVTTHINECLEVFEHQKYSKETIGNYRKVMNQFETFLSTVEVNRVQDVTFEHLNQYRKNLVDRGLGKRTICTYLRTVRVLFNYLEKHHHIFLNPAVNLSVPSYRIKIQPVPSVEEVEQVLAQPNLKTAVGIRDRALMETTYTCGLRCRELYELTIPDLDIKQRHLKIKGKGNKERMVPIGKQAVFWLEKYLETSRPNLIKSENEQALWIGKTTGRKLSYVRMKHLVSDYGKAAKGSTPITIHSLRRACATHMLKNGAHPVQIQTLLGHATLKNLSQYLRVTITDLKKMHERSNPGQ